MCSKIFIASLCFFANFCQGGNDFVMNACDDRQTPPKVNEIAFVKVGSFDIDESTIKNYYVSRHFKSFWIHTRSICHSYGMEIVSLDTQAEADLFLASVTRNIDQFEQHTHIGGMSMAGRTKTGWCWANSGDPITYPLKWGPGEPNSSTDYCMALIRPGNDLNNFYFNDLNCYGVYEFKFVCQQIVPK